MRPRLIDFTKNITVVRKIEDVPATKQNIPGINHAPVSAIDQW